MVAMARVFEGLVCIAFYAGICYLLFDGAARRLRESPLLAPPPPRLVIVSALHDYSCSYPRGDYVNMVSAVNKQDYARLHNYEVLTPSTLADPTLRNMWNKIGWLLKAMNEYDSEWFLWIDIDTVIIDPTFKLPFQRFVGKDLIIWGNRTALLAGDALNGMNSGVMLFRKGRWAQEFLEDVAKLGRIPEPKLQKVLEDQLTRNMPYDSGLRDQNAIVYLLKKHWDEHASHVLLVNKQYCLNCYWRDLLALDDFRSDENRVTFINHFSGCQMCTALNKNGDLEDCEREYVKTFEYANSVMMKLLARKAPRNITLHESLLKTNYCMANPDDRTCRESARALERASLMGATGSARPIISRRRDLLLQ